MSQLSTDRPQNLTHFLKPHKDIAETLYTEFKLKPSPTLDEINKMSKNVGSDLLIKESTLNGQISQQRLINFVRIVDTVCVASPSQLDSLLSQADDHKKLVKQIGTPTQQDRGQTDLFVISAKSLIEFNLKMSLMNSLLSVISHWKILEGAFLLILEFSLNQCRRVEMWSKIRGSELNEYNDVYVAHFDKFRRDKSKELDEKFEILKQEFDKNEESFLELSREIQKHDQNQKLIFEQNEAEIKKLKEKMDSNQARLDKLLENKRAKKKRRENL